MLVVVVEEGKEDSVQVDDGKQGDRDANDDKYASEVLSMNTVIVLIMQKKNDDNKNRKCSK